MVETKFGRAYYERHYHSEATRVADEESVGKLADFVCAYVRYLELEVETVLDLGCGLGRWKGFVEEHFPGCRYTGVEVSAYLCEERGWEQGSVVDYVPEEPADFVICQGVLQYLDDAAAERAIENLARVTGGALYLEALTRRDWEEACSQALTDGDVFLRKGAWYRERLARHITTCGGGLFVPHDADVVLYELEVAEPG